MSRHVDESGVVRAIVKAIVAGYPSAWVVKIHGSPNQRAGIPDLLCCVAGRFIGIEVKFDPSERGAQHSSVQRRVTAQQRAQLEAIARSGGVSGVATCVAEALALIRAALGAADSAG